MLLFFLHGGTILGCNHLSIDKNSIDPDQLASEIDLHCLSFQVCEFVSTMWIK